MKIIYPNEGGGIAVIHPSEELSVDQIAKKDVPIGVPYLIVQDSDIPTDRTYRYAWTADFSAPDGHGGDT